MGMVIGFYTLIIILPILAIVTPTILYLVIWIVDPKNNHIKKHLLFWVIWIIAQATTIFLLKDKLLGSIIYLPFIVSLTIILSIFVTVFVAVLKAVFQQKPYKTAIVTSAFIAIFLAVTLGTTLITATILSEELMW